MEELTLKLKRKTKKQSNLAVARIMRVDSLSAWAAAEGCELEWRDRIDMYSVYATKYGWKVSCIAGVYNPCTVYMTKEGVYKAVEVLNKGII